jgi:hypothetical protein
MWVRKIFIECLKVETREIERERKGKNSFTHTDILSIWG